MAKLKDTEIDGNLYVSGDIQVGDIQIGNVDVANTISELKNNVDTLNSSEKVVGQAFRYLGELSSEDDVNNCMETGFYTMASSPANITGAWSMLLVFQGAGGGVHQMSFAGGVMKTRSYTGSPLKWTNWCQYQQIQ